MKALKYEQGVGFSEHELPDWDGDGNYATYAERNGFRGNSTDDGDEGWNQICIYESHEDDDRFLVTLDLLNDPEIVFVQGRANLLALSMAWAPRVTAGLLSKWLPTIDEVLTKQFKATHGHSSQASCPECQE